MQFSVFYFVIFYEGRYVIMVHILTSHEGRSLLGFFFVCVCDRLFCIGKWQASWKCCFAEETLLFSGPNCCAAEMASFTKETTLSF